MPIRPIRFAVMTAIALNFMAPPLAFAHETEKREPMIIVSGQADAAIAPDLAIVNLSVVETMKTAREALDANSKSMSAVLKALKDGGIADKDLQTSGFSIQPQYSYPESSNGTANPPVLVGFTVTNGLTVRVRDITKLGAILDQSVTLGVNQGGDVRFTNDNPEKAIETARIAAVKNAVAKAKILADAAGVKLGRVIQISEDSSPSNPQPLPRLQMAKEASDAVPIAAGENIYSVTVNVTFGIEQ